MRISDWSSDVCSSDLMISTRLVGGGLVTELGKPTWCRAAISGETRLLVGEETLGVCRQSGLGTREAIVIGLPPTPHGAITAMRSAERRVGNEHVRTFRSRWCPATSKKKKDRKT